MLAVTRYFDNRQNEVWLVWLHGLLGNQRDWGTILSFMRDWPCLTVDLPGHGESVNIRANSFVDVNALLTETLKQNNISQYILIGYSLGGRIAMYHACNSGSALKGLAVEGGNLGLKSVDDKQHRILHDHLWANKFRSQPLDNVLNEWYRQPVFSDLSSKQREQFIAYRRNNDAQRVADILESTSLGRQPWLGDNLCRLHEQNKLPLCYLCGEYDAKFQNMAAEYGLPLKIIAQAGHNAHRSNPQGFSQQLISFLKEC